MDVIHLLSLLVIRLEVAVTQGPSRGDTIPVLKLLKVPLPQTEVVGAIHLGGAAHEVMTPGLEGLSFAVVPDVLGDIAALLKDGLGIPILWLLG